MLEFAIEMREDLILNGFKESSQDSYVRAVRQLEEYTHKRADETEEQQLRDYFLYLINVKKFVANTTRRIRN